MTQPSPVLAGQLVSEGFGPTLGGDRWWRRTDGMLLVVGEGDSLTRWDEPSRSYVPHRLDPPAPADTLF